MRYLVCRKDAIKRNGGTSTINSSCFPIEVEMHPDNYSYNSETIVRKAFDSINEGYVGMYDYVVVPLDDAKVVSFRRKPEPKYVARITNY